MPLLTLQLISLNDLYIPNKGNSEIIISYRHIKS